MKQKIIASRAPKELGAYSNAIIVDKTIFVSGQLPVNPENGSIAPTIQEQTAQVIKNVSNILADAGKNYCYATRNVAIRRNECYLC